MKNKRIFELEFKYYSIKLKQKRPVIKLLSLSNKYFTDQTKKNQLNLFIVLRIFLCFTM